MCPWVPMKVSKDTWVVLEAAAENAVGVRTALVNEAVDDAVEARLRRQSHASGAVSVPVV